MNKNQLKFFKTLLFVLGLGVIAAAFMLVNYPIPESGLRDSQKFFWAEIVVCYLVFFVPLFYSSITSKNFDGKITSTVHIWVCVFLFEIAAITLSVLVLKGKATIRMAALIELVVFFLCAVFVYFGYFAGNHIEGVQARETASLSKINELKTAFSMLNLKTDMWQDNLHEQKAKIKKICDDVKYMSPVDSEAAQSLEMKLIVAANVLAEANLAPADMDAKILELTNTIKQRKLLRK